MTSPTDSAISKSTVRQLEREWSRWGRYVSLVRTARLRFTKSAASRYHSEYRSLYTLCQETAAQTSSTEMSLYREMLITLDPWPELSTLKDVDTTLLADLERRAAALQRRIYGRSISWLRRAHIQFPAVVLAVIGISVWIYSHSGEMTSTGPLAAIRREFFQLWRKTVYSLQEVNAVEIATLLVSMAVLMGMLSVMRTRRF